MSALTARIEQNSVGDGSCWFVGNVSPVVNHVLGNQKQQLLPTLFIYQRGHVYSTLEWLTKSWTQSPLRSLIARVDRFHQDRTNPRSLDYMQEILNRRLGEVGTTQTYDLSVTPKWGECEQMILLWPDGNGLGWFHIERQIFRQKNPNTAVYVLNGRNRLFELKRTLWRGYRLRRFLEKSFLLEFGVLGVFLLTAPVLALWDMTRDAMYRGE